nr:immunoglobulin heavy chain junction region [Mus musculus]
YYCLRDHHYYGPYWYFD